LVLMSAPPGVREVIVGDGDHERDQQGLCDTAMGQRVLGVAVIEAGALGRPLMPSVLARMALNVPVQAGLR
jgi:hypothetical protein